MTLHPIHPPTDRKDINTLILNQADAPCLPCGLSDAGGHESFMAFLMRLYAYFVSKFYDEMADAKSSDAYSPLAPRCEGSIHLKARLLTSGPYQMSASQRDGQRPHTPRVTSVPRSLARRGWLILWPGAARDVYINTGRSAFAFHEVSKSRVYRGDSRHAPSVTMVLGGAIRFGPWTLPNIRIVKRLIPP